MSKEYDGVFVGETMLAAERFRKSFCEALDVFEDNYLTVTPRALRSYGLPGVQLRNLVFVDSGVSLSSDTRVALLQAIRRGGVKADELKVFALR